MATSHEAHLLNERLKNLAHSEGAIAFYDGVVPVGRMERRRPLSTH
jgi:hypothetical protein